MKTTKLHLKTLVLLAVTASAFMLAACSEDNILGTGGSLNVENSSDLQGDTGISIKVGKQVGNDFYLVTVINNSRDTINDFHAQMLDSTVKFLFPNTMNSGWLKSYGGNNHSDSSKVDLKTQRGSLAYQPIKPGQSKQLLGFYVAWGKSTAKKRVAFNWQATKDSVVIKSGTYRE